MRFSVKNRIDRLAIPVDDVAFSCCVARLSHTPHLEWNRSRCFLALISPLNKVLLKLSCDTERFDVVKVTTPCDCRISVPPRWFMENSTLSGVSLPGPLPACPIRYMVCFGNDTALRLSSREQYRAAFARPVMLIAGNSTCKVLLVFFTATA